MTYMALFVLKEELIATLRMLANRRDLRACLSRKGNYELFEMDDLSFDFLDDPMGPKLFLCPKSQILTPPYTDKTILPRFMGWIRIVPGRLCVFEETQVLTMTMLQAEDRQEIAFKPATWLRQLKKDLTKQFRTGVYGENVRLGKGRDYPDILYSVAAAELLQSGVVWRQYPDNRVTFFRPVDDCPDKQEAEKR